VGLNVLKLLFKILSAFFTSDTVEMAFSMISNLRTHILHVFSTAYHRDNACQNSKHTFQIC